MALNFISKDSMPAYTALSSDIVGNKIIGANIIGKTVFLLDSGVWYIIEPDLTLRAYTLPLGTVLFDSSNMSAFNTLEVGDLTPLFQSDFVYGLNIQKWATATTSGTGASVDTSAGRLRIQSGTSSTGYAYQPTRTIIRYRAGEGNVARFTPVFSSGVVNNIQLWGIGTLVSNVPYDGYFFGYNGTSFGTVHYVRGTAFWTPQTAWLAGNGKTGSFNYDPTKGSPIMIKYPYLGFGNVQFYIENPNDSRMTLVHTIHYANTVATTQLSNPSMQFFGFTLNSGNTTNQIMYCGSVGIFISGQRSFIGNPQWAIDSYKTAITTEVAMLNIKNCTTYNGVTNRGMIRLNSISASNSANTTALIRLKLSATIGGSPSYTTINGTTADGGVTITSGNSIASYDVAGTTVSGGVYVFNIQINPSGGQIIDVTPFNIYIAPAEIMTISGFAIANTNIGVSVNWSEDV